MQHNEKQQLATTHYAIFQKSRQDGFSTFHGIKLYILKLELYLQKYFSNIGKVTTLHVKQYKFQYATEKNHE